MASVRLSGSSGGRALVVPVAGLGAAVRAGPDGEREREREPSCPKLLVTVEEAAWMLSIGRTMLYELLAVGVIRSVQIKRSRLVPVAELEAYVQALLAA